MRATLDSATELTPVHPCTIAPSHSVNATRVPASFIELPKGTLHSQQIETGESVAIRVVDGICWITLEGDPADYVVESGAVTCLNGPGLLVIEGLTEINAVSIGLPFE